MTPTIPGSWTSTYRSSRRRSAVA
ncbi:MAG: hypothetical protein DMG08_01530 [Acidobacteria bacterium]|nr:MAG: hypothetical protein DMG08_01530 [Acidobacteriota bacterium]